MAWARQILADMTAAMRGWRDVAARHGLDAAEVRAMEPAFAALEVALPAG